MIKQVTTEEDANQSPLLTVKEVAQVLALSCKVVYRLCESGKLPHHRFGLGRGTIRIDRADLRRFIASTKVEPKIAALTEFDHLA